MLTQSTQCQSNCKRCQNYVSWLGIAVVTAAGLRSQQPGGRCGAAAAAPPALPASLLWGHARLPPAQVNGFRPLDVVSLSEGTPRCAGLRGTHMGFLRQRLAAFVRGHAWAGAADGNAPGGLGGGCEEGWIVSLAGHALAVMACLGGIACLLCALLLPRRQLAQLVSPDSATVIFSTCPDGHRAVRAPGFSAGGVKVWESGEAGHLVQRMCSCQRVNAAICVCRRPACGCTRRGCARAARGSSARRASARRSPPSRCAPRCGQVSDAV